MSTKNHTALLAAILAAAQKPTQQSNPKGKGKGKGKKKKGKGGKRWEINIGNGNSVGYNPRSDSGFTSKTQQSTIFVEDEIVARVFPSVAFETTAYAINPGQKRSFPWLYKKAAGFSKYHFLEVQYYYRPVVSDFADNGKQGKVIFSVQTNAQQDAPQGEVQAMDTSIRADAMPYQKFSLNFKKTDPVWQEKFVRTDSLSMGEDIKTFDIGNLFVSVEGCANTSGYIGELRVKYKVQFSEPILELEPDMIPNAPQNYCCYNVRGTDSISINVPTGDTELIQLSASDDNPEFYINPCCQLGAEFPDPFHMTYTNANLAYVATFMANASTNTKLALSIIRQTTVEGVLEQFEEERVEIPGSADTAPKGQIVLQGIINSQTRSDSIISFLAVNEALSANSVKLTSLTVTKIS